MIDIDNIVEVPGWTIDKVAASCKKITVTLSLSNDIIGDRASNVVRGLVNLQADEHPTFIGVHSPNESDSTQAVLPLEPTDNLSNDEDDEEADASAEGDSEDFIEVS